MTMKSTGIIITATVIAGGNDWLQTNQIPWRIGAAGLLLSWLMGGVEKVSEKGALALSATILVTALFVPLNGKSPVDQLFTLSGNLGSNTGIGSKSKGKTSTGTSQAPGTHTAGGRG